jgi:3-oxoacyl-[acyl-carrier protein] reductase
VSQTQRRVALVTGGSRGIGAAVVLQLARDGYDVSMCFRSNREAADKVAAQARELGARALARQVDVADLAAVRAFVDETEDELGGLDAVVTNAGITQDRPLALMAEEDWRGVLSTNLDGTYHVFRSAIRRMMKRRSGAIVALSSVTGVAGNPMQTNYAASKAGIIGLCKALAKEVGRYGIRVNVVAPGLVDTDMTVNLPSGVSETMISRVALGRMGTASEVAEVVSFLVSPRSSYVTGQVLIADGGMAL